MEESNRSRVRNAIRCEFDRIIAGYVAALHNMKSPLARPRMLNDTIAQARSILDRLGDNRAVEMPDMNRWLSGTRTVFGVGPEDSIRATGALFEAALPVMREALIENNALDELVEIVTEIHEEIYAKAAESELHEMFVPRQLHEFLTRERRSLARELHDRVSHTIAAGLQQLDLRSIDLSRGDAASANERLRRLRDSLVEVLAIIRELESELRSSPTQDGLVAALHRYVDTIAKHGLDIRLHVDGDLDAITGDIRDELYFVLREAIRNASSHSSSDTIIASIAISDGRVEAVVEDFGTGFDTKEYGHRGTGGGLVAMRERVEFLGGSLKIVSAQGLGTRVTASVLV